MMSRGNVPLSSIAAARGATTSRANCSAASLNACCSGVRSKFIRPSTQKSQRSQSNQVYFAISAISALNGVFCGEAREDRPQPLGRHRKILWKDAGVADDTHEVGVAVPARHHVNVQMIEDAGAGGPPKIDADVDAVRMIRLAERQLCEPCQTHQLRPLFGGRR